MKPTIALPDLPCLALDHGHRIVLGIDPGTQVVGYGAIVAGLQGPALLAAGCLRAPRGVAVPIRLGLLRRGVDYLVERLRPEVVVVERAFACLNVHSALRIGEGRGVILASAAAAGARVVEYSPAAAKKALVGNGAADKSQVAAMVAARLGLAAPPGSLDATDALALALAFVEKERLAGRLDASGR